MTSHDSVLRLPRRVPLIRGPLEMTALIDIVLLLIIFFLLSSTFVLQPGIRVDPPRSIYAAGSRSNAMMVTIVMREAPPRPGTESSAAPVGQRPLIFFRDEMVTMDDLTATLASLPPSTSNRPLVINADKAVPLGIVTQVMTAAMENELSVVIGTQQER